MENHPATRTRIQARDAALRLLNRLTAAVAFSAVAGVGIIGLVSAETIPGTTTASSTSSTSTTSSTTSTTTSGGLQSTSAPTSSSSGGGVAVSGGS